ncbi:MAG: NAD(P) transhydrogenase subunit alpha [Actinobacteria bacterium]|nr:NAD(P) transhydrogenase subunit alpha [Actinomycetota bacterium]
MASGIMELITVFVLAIFIGFEVISNVPSLLHTPLMSGTNAIHGVILVGAMIIAGNAHTPVQMALGFVAVLLATLNVVGGFVVTDRMLEMFKPTKKPSANSASSTDTSNTFGTGQNTPTLDTSKDIPRDQ